VGHSDHDVRSSLPIFVVRKLAVLVATLLAAAAISFVFLTSSMNDRSVVAVAHDVPTYLSDTFLHGDFGETHGGACNPPRPPPDLVPQCGRYGPGPIAHLLADRVPIDLQLILGGLLFGALAGIAAGWICAVRPQARSTDVLKAVTAFQLSCPPYWQGLMVLVFFAAGTGSVLPLPFLSGQDDFAYLSDDPLGWAKAMWMPMVLVGLPLAAYVARIADVALREQLHEDYLRTARSKGLRERIVVGRHALPVATTPIALMTGMNMPTVLLNAALMESAFNIPGYYRMIKPAFYSKDLPVIQGLVVEGVVLVVVANVIVDIIQAALDPRVRA
jgi:peptide/nickel transport system permease protein